MSDLLLLVILKTFLFVCARDSDETLGPISKKVCTQIFGSKISIVYELNCVGHKNKTTANHGLAMHL